MKYGFVLPFGSARETAAWAKLAEQAGWDGLFVSDSLWGIDAWVSLTAAVMMTEKIYVGTLLSPLSRMRPWDIAAKAVTLDHLSHGRLILSIGLGAPDTGFANFGEVTDRKTRTELMDEGLDILYGLWQGQPFNYTGKHYQIKETTFSPPPSPLHHNRVPIWIVGAWGYDKSMRRVLRGDGLLPSKIKKLPDGNSEHQPITPDELREIQAWVAANRTLTTPFDYVIEAPFGADPATEAALVTPWREAGATWWIDSMWNEENSEAGKRKVQARIALGPVKG